MKYLIAILLFLTVTLQAVPQRYNYVTDDLTQWTDRIYVIVDGDSLTFVYPDGIVKGSISAQKALGNIVTIKNFILTVSFKDDNGNVQTLKYIEGIEYGDDVVD